MVHYSPYLANMIPRLSCTALYVRQAYPIPWGIAHIVCTKRCPSFCVTAGWMPLSDNEQYQAIDFVMMRREAHDKRNTCGKTSESDDT